MTETERNQEPAVELLRATYESFNRSGVAAFADVLAPEVEWLEGPRVVARRHARSEDVLARMEQLGWNDWRMEPEDFVVQDDRVVVPLRVMARSESANGASARTR